MYQHIKIKKAKLIGSNHLSVEYTEKVQLGENDVKKKCDAIVHDDLKTAFSKLTPHIESVCEIPNHSDVYATGFTISDSGDEEGIVLIGASKINAGILNLVAPHISMGGDYEGLKELSLTIEECKVEILEYLFNGKHKPDAQLDLGFTDGDDEDEL